MLIIPAIDLSSGAAVRLVEGRAGSGKVYDTSPVDRALRFLDAGARRLHVVDLDGAFEGRPKNAALIEAIARETRARGAELEVGGGLRSEAAIAAALELGATYAIAGTMLLTDPAAFGRACARHPGRVIAGIDARAGEAFGEGWVTGSGQRAELLAREAERHGAAAIIYTDISRDGTGLGVNVEQTERLAEVVAIPVIASGGARGPEDLAALRRTRLFGVIVGRAIYEGTIDLAEALRS